MDEPIAQGEGLPLQGYPNDFARWNGPKVPESTRPVAVIKQKKPLPQNITNMYFINKLKKVAKEVNVFTLVGAMVLSVMLMSFEKETIKLEQGKETTTVLRGVIDVTGGLPGRIYLTPTNITPTQGDCGPGPMPCKIHVDPELIDWDADAGADFIDENDEYDIESANGPYSE